MSFITASNKMLPLMRNSAAIRSVLCSCRRPLSSAATEPLTTPPPSSSERVYPEKIQKIVTEISQLTLLEVADLNQLLKTTLNIPDAPMMAVGAVAAQAAAQEADEVEEQAPQKVQTNFTVRLTGFDASKKVAIIKEIKNLVEGMNLVQAKKFVESCPAVVRADVAKDEAEKVKEALLAAGGTVDIE